MRFTGNRVLAERQAAMRLKQINGRRTARSWSWEAWLAHHPLLAVDERRRDIDEVYAAAVHPRNVAGLKSGLGFVPWWAGLDTETPSESELFFREGVRRRLARRRTIP